MYINQNIAYYRKLCGYTQEQLAERLGVTGQSVSKWENEISNPDISVLPDLAKAFGIDINALFEETPNEPKQICFTELPELCYEAILPLYLKAQRAFYGIKGLETEESLQKRIDKMKTDFDFPIPKCAYMIDEGDPEHGAVFLSDALTFIDRSYGSSESVLLFDLDKAGEMLSVLGNRNARKVLRVIYENLITKGEGETSFTPEELADVTGLTTDVVNEAAVQLRHIRLLDENEKIQKDGYKKEYCVLYPKDLIFALVILRLAYIHTSDMTYTTLMYRDANHCLNYDGAGL